MILLRFRLKAREPTVVFNTNCNTFKGPAIEKPDNLGTLEDFLYQDSYDFVIEQFYLIFSYTSTYCYNQIGTIDNTWGELPMLLKQEYLYPLRKQWKNPGNWVNYYPLMFNGFNMEMQRQSLMNCLQAMILQTPFYDPLARPPEFYEGGNSTAADKIGKLGDDRKKAGDARRKRQWQRKDVESFEDNDIAQENPPKSKPFPLTTTTARSKPISPKHPELVNGNLIPSISTTVQSIVQVPAVSTTTAKATTNDSTIIGTSSYLPLSSTSEPEEETKRPSRRRRIKNKPPRKGKKKRNKKHSKLLRRNKAEASTTVANE